MIESTQQHQMMQKQATDLNKLLEDITWNWQSRGLPVMVCVSSFSLFTPNTISEAHVQVLHVPLRPSRPLHTVWNVATKDRLSLIDPFAIVKSEVRRVAVPRSKINRRGLSPYPLLPNELILRYHHHYYHHHQQLQLRDRTRPWSPWPNAIPTRKRDLMSNHVDRYGVDLYFRAWMRADVNSRTTCTLYAKYMIEKEDDPFVNKHLAYVAHPGRYARLWGPLIVIPKKWKESYPGIVNRKNYEHNRRLECRRTVEHGSRLRLIRFGFRHPIYPPHTLEIEELGLTREAYQIIIDRIKDIRQINAIDRRVVWTIEKIPSVYKRTFLHDKKDWEISAWNGEDPLELHIQLEKWGIIESRLDLDGNE